LINTPSFKENSTKMAISVRMHGTFTMTETEYKEKVKIDDDQAKIEREAKDEFGNKVKEKQSQKGLIDYHKKVSYNCYQR
jgi:galactokinase